MCVVAVSKEVCVRITLRSRSRQVLVRTLAPSFGNVPEALLLGLR
jgi:hypothetical protein